MPDLSYYLRNTGETGIVWGGQTISADTGYNLQDVDFDSLLSNPTFVRALETGMAVLNDGISDLSYDVAMRALRREPLKIGDDVYESSTGQSATTSTQWQTKVSLSMTVPIAGTFSIYASAMLSCKIKNNPIYVRLYIDDSIERQRIVTEMNSLDIDDDAFTSYAPVSVVPLSAGAHTVKLQYHSFMGKETYIKEASLIVRRLI